MKKTGLTGNQLKILAMVFMTCDHVGLQLLPQWGFLRIIGRLALPIYAYLIAEGCRHTRSRGKYLARMAGLALVCQAVYFVAMGSLYQCILVTFSLSIALIWSLDEAKERPWLAVLTALSVVAVCEVLPRVLTGTDFAVDYGIWGVLLPVLVYAGRQRDQELLLLGGGLAALGVSYGGIQWLALLALPVLALYNGRRGKYSLGKLFYLYYPLHLVVLYGLSLVL